MIKSGGSGIGGGNPPTNPPLSDLEGGGDSNLDWCGESLVGQLIAWLEHP